MTGVSVDPIAILRERIRAAGSLKAWATHNELDPGNVHKVLSGVRPPSDMLLHALGLERVILYRPRH